MMERPLLVPLLAAMLGIVTAGGYGCTVSPLLLPVSLVVSICAVWGGRRRFFLATVFFLFFVAGNLSLTSLPGGRPQEQDLVRYVSREPRLIEGVIDSRPVQSDDGGRLYIQAERLLFDKGWKPVHGRMLIYVREGVPRYRSGDRIRCAARLREPRNYGLPGEFDYRRYLAFQDVHVTAVVQGPGDLLLMKSAVAFPLQRWIDVIAERLGGFVNESVPLEQAVVLRALLLGDTGGLDRETRSGYSRAGVSHILSISGLHIGIIAVVVFQLLYQAARCSRFLLLHLNLRRSLLIVTLPILVFYLLLTGGAPATVRSVIMISACIGALLVEREVDIVNSLILAALLILGISPQSLFDISFQLSFLALWGIVILTPLLMKPWEHLSRKWVKTLLLFLMVSVAATIATIVPVAYHFHQASVAGIVANFIVVPLLGYGAVISGFIALPLVYVAPFLSSLLLILAGWCVKLAGLAITFFAGLPELPYRSPGTAEFVFMLLLLAALTFVKGKRSRFVCCGGVAIMAVILIACRSGDGSGSLRITFFSVGQGESTLIRFPDGKTMLIDGGGSLWQGGSDVGERLLAPALWSMGVDTIDYLVLTHPHPDHMKGLLYIAENFPVGEFWESGASTAAEEYGELKGILRRRKVPILAVGGATPAREIGGANLEFLYPEGKAVLAGEARDESLNEMSLVFRLSLGDFSLLFTGDIGVETEQFLLGRSAHLASSVLKVPHHGSRYSSSSAFLEAVSPRLALISAGFGNSFGLPAPETLSRLQRKGVQVYRTDMDGTVELRTDGAGWQITTVSPAGHFN